MQVITGTKREITLQQWRERIEKHMKRAEDSLECFRRYSEKDDLEHLKESALKVLENVEHAISAIEYMDIHNIE